MTVRAQWRSVSDRAPEPAAFFAHEMLAAHNDVRARVDVPPLRWSDRLAARAQDWYAEGLALLRQMGMPFRQ